MLHNNSYSRVSWGFMLIFLAALIVARSAAADDFLKRAEKLLSSMRGSLDLVAVEIRKATDKSDVSLVNCLKQREASMKNYVKASLRNQENLRSALKVKDLKEEQRFLKLIETAHTNVKEIEEKLKECWKGEIGEKRTKVVVIKPEGGVQEEQIEEMFPEGEEGTGEEGFPPVPPASPYR